MQYHANFTITFGLVIYEMPLLHFLNTRLTEFSIDVQNWESQTCWIVPLVISSLRLHQVSSDLLSFSLYAFEWNGCKDKCKSNLQFQLIEIT